MPPPARRRTGPAGPGGRRHFPHRDDTGCSFCASFNSALSTDQVRLTEVLKNVEKNIRPHSRGGRDGADPPRDITGRGRWLMNIDFVAVAHREHPLSALQGPLDDQRWPGAGAVSPIAATITNPPVWTFSTIDAAGVWCCTRSVSAGCRRSVLRPQLQQSAEDAAAGTYGARRATPFDR